MNLEFKLKYYPNKIRDFLYKFSTKKLVLDIKEVLKKIGNEIPVFLISYNNAIYVENLTIQLNKKGIKPIIIDNKSSDKLSIKILKNLKKEENAHVIFSNKNFGHIVGFLNSIYKILPDIFAYSDPDLELNKNLPNDFLNTLKNMTIKYKVYKAGFALELLEEEMTDANIKKYYGNPMINLKTYSIKEWENKYWRFRLDDELEVYKAPLDTTFALYNKKYFGDDFFDGVRVAGDFSVIHLPWYPKRDLMSKKQKKIYLKSNKSSTWVKV